MPQGHVHVVHVRPCLPGEPQVRCDVTSNLPSGACHIQVITWSLSLQHIRTCKQPNMPVWMTI